MVQYSSRRAIICPDCGKYVLAGSRGPLPTRCRQCRARRRRPILPERLAGKTTCSRCGATVPVTGRRGRLPQFCRACRGEAANEKRRNGPPISGLLTPEDWDPYLPPPLKCVPLDVMVSAGEVETGVDNALSFGPARSRRRDERWTS